MKWYYAQDKQQKGPVNDEQFAELVRMGVVRADTLVWKAGMSEWQPYGKVFSAATQPPSPGHSPDSSFGSPQTPASFSALPVNDGRRERALSMVKGPAICLMILGALSAFMALRLFLGASQTDIYDQIKGLDPQMVEMTKRWHPVSSVVSGAITLLCAVVLFFGGYRMMNLKSYGLSFAAALCTFQPCVCPWCCLGIAFGIWALVVLNNAEVKAQFD
ncbi:MAG: DUF4339 domain-containing protein [Verrucomicrobiota bacterium]